MAYSLIMSQRTIKNHVAELNRNRQLLDAQERQIAAVNGLTTTQQTYIDNLKKLVDTQENTLKTYETTINLQQGLIKQQEGCLAQYATLVADVNRVIKLRDKEIVWLKSQILP
ncbi:MAG TPA: hypothetical protein VGB67_00240 [Fibrella sp.]|jgi:hypothetical protein